VNNKEEKEISVDILKHIEDLSNKVNKMMAPHAKTVFHRYPITFGLLILLGVTALQLGLKEVISDLGLLDINPIYLILIGIIILIITGTIYKKLEK
jgi:hypothetical protein